MKLSRTIQNSALRYIIGTNYQFMLFFCILWLIDSLDDNYFNTIPMTPFEQLTNQL